MTIKEFAVLGVSTKDSVNIGDYIQGVASMQFLPNVSKVIQRELLKDYDGGKIGMIMNGWYMHNPSQWPPSPDIVPCFVAFHLNVVAQDCILSPEGISYLKAHEPIGCRDFHTVQILKANGIDAYFSGCMTLTLGYSYKSPYNSGRVYFVDPPVRLLKSELPHLIRFTIGHPFKTAKILKVYKPCLRDTIRNPMKQILYAAQFLKTYSKIFDEKTLLNAEYICQQAKYIKEDHPTEKSLFEYAKELVRKYSEADFVVTSRIHCALPCLGLDTPVLYVDIVDDTAASKCRFGGLSSLFNILTLDNGTLKPSFKLNGHISSRKDFPNNKTDWKVLASSLKATCTKWIETIN